MVDIPRAASVRQVISRSSAPKGARFNLATARLVTEACRKPKLKHIDLSPFKADRSFHAFRWFNKNALSSFPQAPSGSIGTNCQNVLLTSSSQWKHSSHVSLLWDAQLSAWIPSQPFFPNSQLDSTLF
jgi:hypothetical protein